MPDYEVPCIFPEPFIRLGNEMRSIFDIHRKELQATDKYITQ